jgi:hypothetical protein
LKIAPQRGHVLALAEIIPPQARHEVILVMTSRDFLATTPAFRQQGSRQAWLRCGPGESYSDVIICVARGADALERCDCAPLDTNARKLSVGASLGGIGLGASHNTAGESSSSIVGLRAHLKATSPKKSERPTLVRGDDEFDANLRSA